MNYMEECLVLANKAKLKGEVPIGAVIVKDGKIIARGYNQRERKQNALLHAEIVAINKACKKLHSWRLDGCEMYVTLEPCPMCAGAILNSRIKKLIFGARDEVNGFAGGYQNLFATTLLNHKTEIEGGVMENECKHIIQEFFKDKRKGNSARQ